MAQALVVSYNKDIVEQARSMVIDTKKYIQLDLNKLAIKYKRMAPIVIAKRMEHLANEFEDEKVKSLLKGFCIELQTAQEYNLTTGEMKLIEISAAQSNGTIRAVLCAYVLYEYAGKPVCDLVMIDMSQKRTADWNALSAGGLALIGAAGVLGTIFTCGLGAVFAATAYHAVRSSIKAETNQENAEALLLKIMEDYGFIAFRGDNKLELLTD
jgi:hypothetical protein